MLVVIVLFAIAVATPIAKTGAIFANGFSSLANLSNVNVLTSSAMGFAIECLFAGLVVYGGYWVLRPQRKYADIVES